MNRATAPRGGYPKSSKTYGAYKWHLAWQVDVLLREAKHTSGVVYTFSPGYKAAKLPPHGGRCPGHAWHGELHAGTVSLLAKHTEAVAHRLCLEACILFGEFAWDACQDCTKSTCRDDYYMVHHDLWLRAHPENYGMLCLTCLQTRLGRTLIDQDFLDIHLNRRHLKGERGAEVLPGI